MPAYDNVSLPGPPDIARAGNYAQMLMQGFGNLGDSYQSGQDFRYRQRNQNLFQNGVPTDPKTGQLDYSAALQKIIQAGGAPAAEKLFPALISQQTGSDIANAINGGGQPQQPNIGPATSTHAGPANITGNFGGGQGGANASRAGYTQPGSDGDAETVRSLTAGIANGRAVQDTAIANYARALGVDPDTPLSAEQEFRARKIIGNNLGTAGGTPANTGGVKPVVSTGYEQDQNNTNEATPVGSTGGAQVSPNPQGAGPGKGETFDSRFNAAQPGTRPTPVGTEAEARQALQKAQQLRSIAARIAGVNPKAAEQAGKAADYQEERAKQIFDALKAYNEPDRTTKAVQSGAARQEALDKSDVERYGKQYDNLQHQLDQAQQMVSTNNVTKSLMDNPSFYSGAGADHILTMQRFAVALGLKPEDYATANEVFGKTVSSTILDQIRSLGGQGLGQVRVAEINVMKQAAQNRDNTPASNRMLTEMQDRMAKQWIIPIAEHAQEYNGGHLDAGFDRWRTKWINDHPLFSKDELADPRRIAPPLVRTPADLRKIGWKDGTPFRTPDGRILTHLAPQ